MALDEGSRHRLYRRLQEVLGDEEATTLMEHLPPGGASRVATKEDLQTLKHELLAEIHRTARNLTLSLTTIVAVLNGIVFTALTLGT
ncbi:MAG TPA: hypothetical protein VHL78_02645 [Actinomycetota bacterium]|nr:hypothetical protein [Actinomycetota bacterium]